MNPDPREGLLELWKSKDGGTGPVLFPPDLADRDLPGALGRRYRLLWLTFEGGARHFDAILREGWQKTPRTWRMILSLGFQELLWGDGREQYAAVDSWVELGRKHTGKKSTGTLNFCLRETARRMDSGALTLAGSLPARLRESWAGPDRTDAELIAWLGGPKVNFWHAIDQEHLPPGERVEWPGGTAVVPERGLAPRDFMRVANHAGFFQNLSAAELCLEVHQRLEGSLLDFCAAPGGKSWQLARLSRGEQSIDMHELQDHRRQLISDNPLLARFPGLRMVDEEHLREATYDQILLDVPCDNSGVLSKAPEAIRHQWVQGDPLAQVQDDILQQGLSLLRKNGTLFYATCSLSSAENERRVRHFCREYELSLAFERRWWPDAMGRHGAYLACLKV